MKLWVFWSVIIWICFNLFCRNRCLWNILTQFDCWQKLYGCRLLRSNSQVRVNPPLEVCPICLICLWHLNHCSQKYRLSLKMWWRRCEESRKLIWRCWLWREDFWLEFRLSHRHLNLTWTFRYRWGRWVFWRGCWIWGYNTGRLIWIHRCTF